MAMYYDEYLLVTNNLMQDARKQELMGLLDCQKSFSRRFNAALADAKAIADAAAAKPGPVSLAERKTAVDRRFDGTGRMLHALTAFYLDGEFPEAIQERAGRIQAAFIPTLKILGWSFEREANWAQGCEAHLTRLEEDLRFFGMADGRSLLDVARGFVEAGRELLALLEQEAAGKVGVPFEGKKAGVVRSELMGAWSDFVEEVGREANSRPELPRTLEQELLGFYLQVKSKREELDSRAHGRPPAAPAEPPATP